MSENKKKKLDDSRPLSLERGAIKRKVGALKSLAVHVDLSESDFVVEFLNKRAWKNRTKNIVLLVYRDWLRMYGLPELKLRADKKDAE